VSLQSEVRAGYGDSAFAWAAGPEVIYQRLADELVACVPLDLGGRPVLDIGAGTGTVSRALASAGATPVAVDLSAPMLHCGGARWVVAVAGDAMLLPFRDRAFAAVVAGFCLSHLPDPVGGLRESARVTGVGGVVVASSFASQPSHPAKAEVEGVAGALGWRAPDWYRRVKDQLEPRTAQPALLAAIGEEAGLSGVGIAVRHIEFEPIPAAVLVAWRLGMAHLAPFVASLEESRREVLLAEAEAAVGPRPDPLCLGMLVMTGVVRP
jgi:SAM-dependent methyltransferase